MGWEKCALNEVVMTTSTVLSSTAVTFMSGPRTPDTWSGLTGMRSTVCRSHASICASTWFGSCTPFPSGETAPDPAPSRDFRANLLANPGGEDTSGRHSSPPPPRAAPLLPGRTMSSLPWLLALRFELGPVPPDPCRRRLPWRSSAPRPRPPPLCASGSSTQKLLGGVPRRLSGDGTWSTPFSTSSSMSRSRSFTSSDAMASIDGPDPLPPEPSADVCSIG